MVTAHHRCPGCDSAAIAARDDFLSSLTASLKAAAPNQLTSSSTEGYFGPDDPNAAYNPGAGGQCEGEDWTKEVAYSDVASAHTYYRSAGDKVLYFMLFCECEIA